MLKKDYRISSRKQIQHLLKKGRTYKSRCFVFKYLEGLFPHPRFAVIVSMKIDKRATQRNRLRRQVNEAIRNNLDRLPCPLDTVIIIRLPAKEAEFKEIERQIIDFFNQTNI